MYKNLLFNYWLFHYTLLFTHCCNHLTFFLLLNLEVISDFFAITNRAAVTILKHVSVLTLWSLYQPALAVITKCHRLGGLNSRSLSSHSPEGWEARDQGPVSSISGEGSLPVLSTATCVLTPLSLPLLWLFPEKYWNYTN